MIEMGCMPETNAVYILKGKRQKERKKEKDL